MNLEQKLIDKWRNLPLDKQQQVLMFIDSLKEQTWEVKEHPLELRKAKFIVPNNLSKQIPDEILD